MAIGKNQYGTYETDKPIGSKRFPVTSEQEKLAQLAYGKNFSELTTDQRTKIRAGKLIEDKITFEQYLEDYKGMASDPNYKPKYIKSGVGVGISPQQKRALAEAKKNIEGFNAKYQKNINKRKKLKRAENPENVKKDLASRAERRVNRRLKEKDVALSPREKNINLEQRKLVKEYNASIRENPNMVLGNKALMEKLSITVSKDGDIIKVPTGLTEKYLKDRGLFEIDHQRDIYKKGKGKNLPYNRNLIMGPYNRTGGFKDMAEKFIAANPDSPKIEAILKQAEDLKVTLQPEVPTGTFKTKGIGYKQASDPLEKFKQVYESEPKGSPIRKGMDDIVKCADGCFVKVANSNPEKTLKKINKEPQKLIRLFETGAVTTANKIPQPPVKSEVENIRVVNEFMQRNPRADIKYNTDAGTFVNTKTNTIDNNFNAKDFAEKNPVEVKAGTEDALKPIKGNLLKTVGKSLAYVGAPLPTALIDSYFVGKQISEDRPAAEIAKDPLNWLGLATMSTLSEISGVSKPGKMNAALRLGMSPGLIRGVSRFAGIPGLAISTALTAYDQYNKYKNEEGLIYDFFNKSSKAI